MRKFSDEPLTLNEWGQILWAAQGITSDNDGEKRATPSAGALYPLDIYLILCNGDKDLPKTGVFQYLPLKHALKQISCADFSKEVAEASLNQYWMGKAPGMILITAEYSRITGKYGDRGIRYAHIEAGHVAQNCFLQAQSLKLNIGIVGAFEDDRLIDLLGIPESHEPILILPIGRSK
jgi:SagB-type dehydrogenase family enzyme